MQASEPISSEKFRYYYMSENTDHQFSRMINLTKKVKNITVNLPHQLSSYDGFFSDNVPLMLQTDNKITLNANNEINNIYMQPNLCNQQDQFIEALPFCSQPYQSATSSVSYMENNVDEYNYCLDPIPPMTGDYNEYIYITSEMNNYCCNNTKKRIPEENKPNKKKKKKKVAEVCCQEQSQDYPFLKNGRGKRSQKLADRITALQKLVSPYGKTDTASVLYEASIFIKVLQDQIQNIFNTLPNDQFTQKMKNTSGEEEEEEEEEKELDLRSKGLCLVPLLLTQKLVEEDLEEEQWWMPSFNTTVLQQT